MTVIAAIRPREGAAIMGGDRYLGDDRSPVVDLMANPKIYPVANNSWFGLAGDPAYCSQIVSVMRSFGTSDLEGLTKRLRKKLPQDRLDCEGLLTWGRNLYYMDAQYAFHESLRPYAAIGVGRDFVMGHLANSHRGGECFLSIGDLRAALYSTGQHVLGVQGPFDYSEGNQVS